ncbi:hypothetical protein OPV22_005606 [Ensete ventricosum]|uniref:Uncharacterized protein n=1 Tax=Ensete ventricosum TaxID=4639 RepID=A0AAV8RRU6_ENSVE|nr:hypothetical protein OPV22_005606 [Ensete ventricosum]
MNSRRDYQNNRAALFDSIETLSPAKESCFILPREIHEEVGIHNHALDRMNHDMDTSRRVLSGTVDRFKRVNTLHICSLGFYLCV